MIVDFHTHIFPPDVRNNRQNYVRRDPTFAEMYSDPAAKVATAEDLLTSMDESGVDVSIALGFAWQDPHDIMRHNSYLIESAAESGGRILPFATVNMVNAGAEMELLARMVVGARGVGELRPDSQGWQPEAKEGARLATIAERTGRVLLFHVTEPGGRTYAGRAGCALESFSAFVRQHPKVKVVGAHLGGGIYQAEGRNAPSVYVDTAAQPLLYHGADAQPALKAVPVDRLLFGSDFPLISQARQIAEIKSAITDDDALQRALGGNAAELLGLADA